MPYNVSENYPKIPDFEYHAVRSVSAKQGDYEFSIKLTNTRGALPSGYIAPDDLQILVAFASDPYRGVFRGDEWPLSLDSITIDTRRNKVIIKARVPEEAAI